ncbi:MAG: hypothetical protein H6834_04945 [Planctomycetes bacterium]|nr:hypothetical protein [Planctomycetota bacterium]
MTRFDRNAPPTSVPTSDRWIVTYTDLVSLLLNFFVLIFTFSTIDERDFQKLNGALMGSRSTLPETREHTKPELSEPPLARRARNGEASERPRVEPYEELARELSEGALGSASFALRFELTDDGDGLRITFPDDAAFLPGRAEPTPALIDRLERLAPLLGNLAAHVEFEGHVSSAFRPTHAHALASELALERARRASLVFRSAWERHGGRRASSWNDVLWSAHVHGSDDADGTERKLTLRLRRLP